MMALTGTVLWPGCWIDSHLGHYAHGEVVKLAQRFGMKTDPFDQLLVLDLYDEQSHMESFPHERFMDIVDEAEAWLNENCSVDGHYWGWNDGDFGLYPLDDEWI